MNRPRHLSGLRTLLAAAMTVTLTTLTPSALRAGKEKAPKADRDTSDVDKAEAPQLQKRIKRLVRELDHDDFTVRETATKKLIEIGAPAGDAVRRVLKSDSAEVRWRAGRIVRRIDERAVLEGFVRLARQTDDSKIDIEHGMWLIARIVDPAADKKAIDKQLDGLVVDVRKRLGRGVDAAKADPAKVVGAIRHVLFTDKLFAGNSADYNNPNNSSIEKVLETRKGLPILLSHVVVAVADRLNVPIVGLQIPGRYMVKYDGSRAPKGFARNDVIIDPYGSGRVLTVDELKVFIGSGFDPAEHLAPSTRRATLTRMLVNLQMDLDGAGRGGDARRVEQYLLILRESR